MLHSLMAQFPALPSCLFLHTFVHILFDRALKKYCLNSPKSSSHLQKLIVVSFVIVCSHLCSQMPDGIAGTAWESGPDPGSLSINQLSCSDFNGKWLSCTDCDGN